MYYSVMNRRGFLAGVAAVIGGIVLEEAIPLGRVWSFPERIVIPKHPFDYSANLYRALKFHPTAFTFFHPPLDIAAMYRKGVVGTSTSPL